MNTKSTTSRRFIWIAAFLLLVLSFLCSVCETKKEFDYWQYVDWESPNHPDDNTDHDAGADGGEMDDLDGGMGE